MEQKKQINTLIYIIFRDQEYSLSCLRKKYGAAAYEEMINESAIDLRTGEQAYFEDADPQEWKHLLQYEIRRCDLSADYLIDDLWEALQYENDYPAALKLLKDLANYAHEFMQGKHNIWGRKCNEFGEYLAFEGGGSSHDTDCGTEYDSWAEFLGIADISTGQYLTFEEYMRKEKEKHDGFK